MIDAVRKTARDLRRDFGEVSQLQVAKKAPADFVSPADLKAEQTLFELLLKGRPGYSFWARSAGWWRARHRPKLGGRSHRRHHNFLPAIRTSHQRGPAARGQVWRAWCSTRSPTTSDWAERGKAPFLGNEVRLRVGQRRTLIESVLATGVPFAGRPGQPFLRSCTSWPRGWPRAPLRLGGVAMAWVAGLPLRRYWSGVGRAGTWRQGQLLVIEAGGRVTDAEGGEDALGSGSVVASNLELHR